MELTVKIEITEEQLDQLKKLLTAFSGNPAGIRLKRLVTERYKEQGKTVQDFIDEFNEWQSCRADYKDGSLIREKDYYRWTHKTKPTRMRDPMIRRFSEFFKVSVAEFE